ncbi:MAG: hypothetical protein QF858_04260 [Candidatus Pacebacteria bacterium]|jgi:hypothetical protein|nr:hypothetical protein [bacterium]MDP6528052.1 hypothetical protein [Candidatus Paceibacterota bacterium]MDP6659578.1 hypothetical protein [Candidatus Paceibacterota bacterium]|tara:strand:+ start:12195 stop:12560 length:366 start_codon:yes stop_codon:yes gene_type:complete
MSIREIWAKIKQSEDILDSKTALILIIILVGTGSFGLGRLSALETKKEPVEIISAELGTDLTSTASLGGGAVVASRNGSKYHYPWCSGAKRIAPQNKVEFSTIEEARRAGYTPAANCKGLK